jgi:glycosyltransferase involved in cell wall biosynthesis
MHKFTASIIIPALNEEVILPQVIEQTISTVENKFEDYEIILINDGSTDLTESIMEAYQCRYSNIRVIHNEKNLGFGASYRKGVDISKGDYIILLCGDGGLPLSSLAVLIPYIGTADIVIPWMVNLKRIKTTGRYLLSRSYTSILNLFFKLKLNYYNGLPIHKASLIKNLEFSDNGFGFQAEILLKLIKSGATFVEVGVNGAEETNQSDALMLKNWLRIFSTVFALFRSVGDKKTK